MKEKRKIISNKKGFTLIEMIVSMGVFVIIMTISMAAFLNIIDMQRKTESFRKLNDNLNFSMEIIMREIMEGNNYPSSCGSGCSTFSFELLGKSIVYSISGNSITRRFDGGNPLSITSSDVKIVNLRFTVIGTGSLKMINISISAITNNSKEKLKSKINLQTTVSQRNA